MNRTSRSFRPYNLHFCLRGFASKTTVTQLCWKTFSSLSRVLRGSSKLCLESPGGEEAAFLCGRGVRARHVPERGPVAVAGGEPQLRPAEIQKGAHTPRVSAILFYFIFFLSISSSLISKKINSGYCTAGNSKFGRPLPSAAQPWALRGRAWRGARN